MYTVYEAEQQRPNLSRDAGFRVEKHSSDDDRVHSKM